MKTVSTNHVADEILWKEMARTQLELHIGRSRFFKF